MNIYEIFRIRRIKVKGKHVTIVYDFKNVIKSTRLCNGDNYCLMLAFKNIRW